MNPEEINHITIVGPGMMGHAIAQEFAAAGFPVILQGRSEAKLERARDNIRRNLEELVQWGLLAPGAPQKAMACLQTTTDMAAATAGPHLVIESIVEELEYKLELFRVLDEQCPQHTILASNTSTLPPTTLAAATRRPDRFLVAHYFNPPYLMPLVELVRGERTSDAAVQSVFRLMAALGKRPIICQKEVPGFIANRLQLVLWREAFNIVQRGIASPQDVDRAVKNGFGRRLGVAGPFEIFEHNDGYDLTLQCEKYMLPDMDTSPDPYPLLLEKVQKGELGAKSGKGFYDWTPEFTRAWRRKMLQNLVGFMKSDRE